MALGLLFLLAVLAVATTIVTAWAPAAPRLATRATTTRLQALNTPSAPSSERSVAVSRLAQFSPALIAASTLLLPSLAAYAADVATKEGSAPVVEKVVLGPPPTNFGLQFKDFYADCQQVVDHMRYAVQMEKGDANIAAVASKTKDEMNDFVSYYRRFNGINGKQSFSLLYTSVNVLAGHYTSYGTKFPVPEKRRKRLMQEFLDVEKNIRKKR